MLNRHLFKTALCAFWLATSICGAEERIIDGHNGETIDRQHLISIVNRADYLLLGEMHDNPLHHQRRAELLAELGGRPAVVAEHLDLGRSVSDQAPLLESLEAAGFETKNWQWPLHAPLFSIIRQRGLTLVGGNIARKTARQIVKEGRAAIPSKLSLVLDAYPMNNELAAKLDADLLANHCNQIPATLIPGLRLAQQVRDAAMFSALAELGGNPSVLLAGNGHVRKDYGIPRLLAQANPASRTISIGFVEEGSQPTVVGQAALYDYLWVTAPATRNDPCADFRPSTSETERR